MATVKLMSKGSKSMKKRRTISLSSQIHPLVAVALTISLTFAPWGALQAQQRLADANATDPEIANVALDQRIPAAPNDLIFGKLAGDFENHSEGPNSDAEAARFLTQATFGPTQTELGELKSIGYAAWVDRQLSLDPTLQRPVLESQVAADVVVNPRGPGTYAAFRQERWFATAATASDQLRQRVAFALSQVMVLSDVGALNNQPIAVSEYNDILLRNAFGSYRTLLKEVTYSPMMGQFLTTLRNQKTDWTLVSGNLTPSIIAPDENYSREIMQLFSVGLIERNRDFSPITIGGVPQPTYNQDIITQTAKAFTGLSYSCNAPVTFGTITLNHNCGCTGSACNFSTTAFFSNPQRYVVPNTPQSILTALYHPDTYRPMMCFPRYADTGRSQDAGNSYAVLPAPNDRKVIIAGVTINAAPVACHSGTAAADRQSCIDYCTNQVDTVVNTLALHPNVAPFLSRQLIQRLTTSNPSAGYIDRVATVFENDGSGTRGNLGAVVKAILLDSEARSTPSANFGKLREPLLRLTAIWRAFGALPASTGAYGLVFPERVFAQRPFGAQSVFNFYEPDFQQSGEIANAGLFSPEFQILDESTAISASDELWRRVFAGYSTAAAASTPFTTPTTTSYLPPEVIDGLPDANDKLLDELDLRMMSGQMSATMKAKLLALMNGGLATSDKRRRALSMVHLIAISPEFVVQR
jgi:uncharacterized protein (DUF1800 family)